MELKDWVSIYGAIVSTVVACWNVYLFLTDRGKLKVHCYIADIVGDGKVLEKNVLTYSVTNIGRKPIYITTIGGKFKKNSGEKSYFLITPRHQMPKKLEPGENFTEYTSDLSVLSNKLGSLHAIDSLGKYHKVKKKVIKELVSMRED